MHSIAWSSVAMETENLKNVIHSRKTPDYLNTTAGAVSIDCSSDLHESPPVLTDDHRTKAPKVPG